MYQYYTYMFFFSLQQFRFFHQRCVIQYLILYAFYINKYFLCTNTSTLYQKQQYVCLTHPGREWGGLPKSSLTFSVLLAHAWLYTFMPIWYICIQYISLNFPALYISEHYLKGLVDFILSTGNVCPLQHYSIALVLWSPLSLFDPLEGLPFWHFRDLSFLCINNSSPVYSTAFQYSIVKIKFNSCKLCSVPPSQFYFINQVD